MYKIQYSPQKSLIYNTNYSIEKIDNILTIKIDNISTIKVIDENTIEINNVEYTKNLENNKFENFIVDTYVVNIFKDENDDIYIELLRQYSSKNAEFSTEIQEF